jgi:hypothetical protein
MVSLGCPIEVRILNVTGPILNGKKVKNRRIAAAQMRRFVWFRFPANAHGAAF